MPAGGEGGRSGAAIDGRPELAGEDLQSATELGFQNRKLPERRTRRAHRRKGGRRRLGRRATRGGRGVPAAVSLCARTERSRNEEMGTGEEKEARGSLPTSYIRARSRGVDRGGAGAASAVYNREREEIGRVVLGKEMNLTGGPHPSATNGREG